MLKAMQVLLHEVDDGGRFLAFRNAVEDSCKKKKIYIANYIVKSWF